ncbi:polysaccharide biosynthesis protein [Vagococcus humatus]|uniref:Polysaccharide biosynthesis protein n=1 Tax=Vagococcus humatus TaxID=1889241 RepID=A0A3R9YFC9_9ENTE|nr:nucleoside-diphosphate sugar epimerase/dehydratase [Vagococcus humatus]RST89903.1 polysaccharide biosynthesis protein [Vagococcus humatus]
MELLTRRAKRLIILTVDTLLILLANGIAYLYMQPFDLILPHKFLFVLAIQLIGYLFFGTFFHVFQRVNRYTSLKELIDIFKALMASAFIEFIICLVLLDHAYSRRYLLLVYLLSMFFIMASRIAWRIMCEYKQNQLTHPKDCQRVLIIGAGNGGVLIANDLRHNRSINQMEVVGFVDDDLNKKDTFINGMKVLGTTKDIPKLVKEEHIDLLTIAIPSLNPTEYERILNIIQPLDCVINTMPSMEEIVNGSVQATKLKKVEIKDLLGRAEVKLDMQKIATQLENQTILVTGAGGSIGSEICRQVFRFKPKKMLLLGHGENSIYQIHRELLQTEGAKDIQIVPIIADVQDRERIFEVMATYHPDIVYHAAAHKHVPLMEYNPREAVKNNVYGTKNVAEASKAHKVKSFVMISTDKATRPPNVMGATKRLAEMIVTSLNETGKTKFSAVRFGNVLGSRGSVVPLFTEQIEKGGPVTVTDFRMTRFFMTIPEASRLVIEAGSLAAGGEIFILDMGEPVKIYDLAKRMVELSGYQENEIDIIETGIRPGEKLYEELLVDKEKSPKQVHDKIFIGNISGFDFPTIETFLQQLPEDDEALAKEVVKFANESSMSKQEEVKGELEYV